jgi:hypothetical protein
VTPAAAVRGIGAALRVPRWLGPRLDRLTAVAGPRSATAGAADPGSIRAAHLTLRLLARVPGGAWRSSCLYRSVAEVLLRRAAGEDAWLRLGARRDGEAIGAHAWVESPRGVPVGRDAANAARFTPLG